MLRMFLIWLGGCIWFFSNMILQPRKVSNERIFRIGAKTGRFDENAYYRTKKKRFTILSDYGYYISCELLEPEGECHNQIVILCHGFSQGKYRSLMFAEIFLRMGFRAIIYDHRNHGLSGKAYTSMGYYEKFDLKKIVDWCIKNYGRDCKIVTHGESMGAATAILHLQIDNRVRCVIADCPYSDLKELLKYQAGRYYHIPIFLVPLESLIAFLRAGFWFGQVAPIKVVKETDTPILFIHGKRDRFVPTKMSVEMYKAKRSKKGLYLVAKAGHAQACAVNKAGYEKVMRRFLEKYSGCVIRNPL